MVLLAIFAAALYVAPNSGSAAVPRCHAGGLCSHNVYRHHAYYRPHRYFRGVAPSLGGLISGIFVSLFGPPAYYYGPGPYYYYGPYPYRHDYYHWW